VGEYVKKPAEKDLAARTIDQERGLKKHKVNDGQVNLSPY